MEETVPKVRGAANVEIVGLMVSLNRMEVGQGGKVSALDEIHEKYGFEGKAIGIKQTILDAVDTLYEKLEKKEINFTLEPFEDRLLYHNRKWTAEVFVNLLENAVKYTDRGGTISICVKSYDLYTEIQIADNGRGIRQEEMTDIFKRFYRSPEVENMEGSGIGLYLSNLILEKEKGYMTVDSEYGKGSCFSVFLQNCKN